LKEISEVASNNGIQDDTLRSSVISAGQCPGSWRVYYALTSRGEKYKKVSRKSYLGIPLQKGLTTHDLGKMFERWVDEANIAFNEFLSTGNQAVLSRIQGMLRIYYRKQGATIMNGTTQDERNALIMDVSPKMQLSLHPPVRVNPDGIFSHGKFGAVFESKSSEPKYPEFMHQSAIYALASEYTNRIDIDYAIVLYNSYPRGKLSSWFKEIDDSSVERVTSNLESFLHLLQHSEVQRANAQNPPTLPSWREFVVRPAGLPDKGLRAPCPKCPYRKTCFEEGNEPRGWATESIIAKIVNGIAGLFRSPRRLVRQT